MFKGNTYISFPRYSTKERGTVVPWLPTWLQIKWLSDGFKGTQENKPKFL